MSVDFDRLSLCWKVNEISIGKSHDITQDKYRAAIFISYYKIMKLKNYHHDVMCFVFHLQSIDFFCDFLTQLFAFFFDFIDPKVFGVEDSPSNAAGRFLSDLTF